MANGDEEPATKSAHKRCRNDELSQKSFLAGGTPTPQFVSPELKQKPKKRAVILDCLDDQVVASGIDQETLHPNKRIRKVDPGEAVLYSPEFKSMIEKLGAHHPDSVVLRTADYLGNSDAHPRLIEALLDALENSSCEALYLQKLSESRHLVELMRVLQRPSCKIWCLSIVECCKIQKEAWDVFADGLKATKITHMRVSGCTLRHHLKNEMRRIIGENKVKHNMYCDPNNLDTISRCTHCWSNPINSKELKPYLNETHSQGQICERAGVRGDACEAVKISPSLRRSKRKPAMATLDSPGFKRLLQKLRANDPDVVVLKVKDYLTNPDSPPVVIETLLDALAENSNCEALYIQGFSEGMQGKQLMKLMRILQLPACKIWCLNIGETYKVKKETWELFTACLNATKITHMYASEHTISLYLKNTMRSIIRENRRKHKMHIDPNNLETILQCTHCWWNPINARALQEYLEKTKNK